MRTHRLTWTRRLDGADVQEFQHFGSALFFHSNRFHKNLLTLPRSSWSWYSATNKLDSLATS
jgi:hypothetical protein